ncbi:MAG TPA: DNA methyltransferase, partial [Armatimonadetes bacterium]|nr:DNA methyltransferase [Armatimonadota bacterium]
MLTKVQFTDYLDALQAVQARGDAREESYYGALDGLLRDAASAAGRHEVDVTTLPKPTDAGNPDFRVWSGTNRVVGYVEAKLPGARLDEVALGEQLSRYRTAFPNLLLTDFCEFRHFRHGEPVGRAMATDDFRLNRLNVAPKAARTAELANLAQLLDRFLDFALAPTYTAEGLALELAKRTAFMRDIIESQMEAEDPKTGRLTGFYAAFRDYLITSLTPEGFADLFAQTVTYGLFAARTRATPMLTRQTAHHHIPHTIGVLHDVFRFLGLDDLSPQLAWCVEDLIEVLAIADVPKILDDYYRQGRGEDPVVHFYETFLAAYDPAERERRGVYYTPEPVVGYIVRSLHALLKSEFGRAEGLADRSVTLLDPAAGTMTFIARATHQAIDEFDQRHGAGMRPEFIREHILRNFYAFELMVAPYAVGHLKMGFHLEELGYKLGADERMPFYLTNSLEEEELHQSALPGFAALATESRLAAEVKQHKPVLVILGNPPYSGHAANNGEWIKGLIEDYKQVDGQPLGERNPKWIQDDYVKFLRFAQWKMDQSDSGVVGMITNNGYLDNPTFRGMRRSLMNTFDAIHVLDLHGNAKKREVAPDGGADQNVFDIMQGVAIVFLVKHADADAPGVERGVWHMDLYGTREAKYTWLDDHAWPSTTWTKLEPAAPRYDFVPRDNEGMAEFERFVSMPRIFELNSVGIVTARDKLTIHFTPDAAWQTVLNFSALESELAREAYDLGADTRDWQVSLAQRDLRSSGPVRTHLAPILYRPYDVRHTYYTGRSRGFICMPRQDVMRHMIGG